MKRIAFAVFALIFCASAQGADRDLLTPEPRRITDEAIAADIGVMQGLQQRLAALNRQGVQIVSYHFAKAQAWLDFALDEYTVNDRSRVVEEALAQALDLIGQLEAGTREIGLATPIIPTSAVIRPDLWEKAETLKKNPDSFRCAGDKIAQLEVQLVWAGHENRELGWRHAKPYLQAAERLAREADAQAAACPQPPVAKEQPPASSPGAVAPALPERALASAAAEKTLVASAALTEPLAAEAAPRPQGTDARVPSPEAAPLCPPCPACAGGVPAGTDHPLVPLPDRVHFALDKADISAASAAVLDRISAAMKADPNLRLVLHGHADQRGEARYNVKLSRQRAAGVRSYLAAAGVAADRIVIAAYGKTRPLIMERTIDGYARNRRVEFIYSIGTPQRAVRQDGDLQPEDAL